MNLVTIRVVTTGDVDALVELSLEAWAPVFASFEAMMGPDLYVRVHPDWRRDQAAAVRQALADNETWVAEAEGRVGGFVNVIFDVAALLGDGAHLVGHSYGGLGAILAAARRPTATLSLTLLEPAVTACGLAEPAWSGLVDALRDFWQDRTLSDHDWVVEFLVAVGSDPAEFPPEFLAEAAASAPLLRNGRPPFDAELPLDAVREAKYPKLVVSGGHHAGFDAMCLDLADQIGAESAVVDGAGHEIQFTGQPLNELLGNLWRRSAHQDATITP
jgi:pimeloyl-ACP methyl ester carboxylesterase